MAVFSCLEREEMQMKKKKMSIVLMLLLADILQNVRKWQ
jgi:hypothetical protein